MKQAFQTMAETSKLMYSIQVLCRESGIVRLEMFELPSGDDETNLLVTFAKRDGEREMRRLRMIEEELAAIFGRGVNVFTIAALRNEWLRNEIWQTRTTIYEAAPLYPYTS